MKWRQKFPKSLEAAHSRKTSIILFKIRFTKNTNTTMMWWFMSHLSELLIKHFSVSESSCKIPGEPADCPCWMASNVQKINVWTTAVPFCSSFILIVALLSLESQTISASCPTEELPQEWTGHRLLNPSMFEMLRLLQCPCTFTEKTHMETCRPFSFSYRLTTRVCCYPDLFKRVQQLM